MLTLASGAASGSFNTLPGGSYNIYGNYGGDGTFAPSTSSKTAITVTPEASTLSLQVSDSDGTQLSSLSGQQVPYGTYAILNGNPVPTTYFTCASSCQPYTYATGTVTFTDNGNALNTVQVNTEGDAEYTTGTLAVGAHSIAASYSGDASYNKSASNPATVAFTVTKGVTSVGVSSALATIAQGQTTVLTALVSSSGGGGAAPTGSVNFMAGSTMLGSGTLSSVAGSYGVATYTITGTQSTALPVGTVSLTGTYAGDSNYGSGTTPAPAATLTVTGPSALAPTTTTATAMPQTTSPASAITLSIAVAGKLASPSPTGTVDLQSAGVDLTPGGVAITAAATGDNSTLTYSLDSASLLQGNNSLVVTYSGDTVFAPSQATVSLSNPRSDFSLVAQTSVVTVASGASGTATLALGAINGFNASVALSCSVPSGLTCTLNPASVTVNGNTTATVTINATTTSSAGQRAWLVASGGATLACILLFGIPARRRKWRGLLGLMVVAILCAGIGCGGGGSGSGGGGGGTNPPPPAPPTTTGTTPGAYTVVITGAASSGSHSVPVKVVVTAAS